MRQRSARALLVAYLLLGVALTLGSSLRDLLSAALARAVEDPDWVSMWGTYRLVEMGANVVLFVPLALLLCWAFPDLRRRYVWLLCFLMSATVEAVQGAVLPGRVSSLVDVVMNSAGAAIGVLAHWIIARSARARPR